MDRVNIVELTDEQVLELYTDRFFKRVYAETPAIPASYDGKYALMCAIAVDVEATETQMDQLETQIEAIANVHKAFILIGPARIPLDRVPLDHELFISVEGGFDIKPEVV